MGSVDWNSGIVNAAYIYGPYGEIVDSVGQEQDDHLRRFNGKESDQLSKLSYYGYRYYDSQSLSWTQADPLYLFVPDVGMDDPRRMSLYTFSLNNPIRYLDPDGRDSQAENDKKKPKAKNGNKRSKKKKKTKTVTIKFIWLKGHGVSKAVRKEIEQRITAKYNQLASRSVTVKGAPGTVQGAADADRGVTVVFGKLSADKAIEIIEKVIGGALSSRDRKNVHSTIGRQKTGVGVRRGNKGVAIVSTDNGLTDDQMLDNDNDRSKYGAAIGEHEVGHGFGLDDNETPGNMMYESFSYGTGQRAPTVNDANFIEGRLDKEAR